MGKPEKKTKPPLPAWGQVASNAFWLTLGFHVVLVQGIFSLESLDGGIWWWVRGGANTVVWTASIPVWTWAVYVRDRNARAEHAHGSS